MSWFNKKDSNEEIRKVTDQDRARGAKEAAALRLRLAERNYSKNPTSFNKAALEAAQNDME